MRAFSSDNEILKTIQCSSYLHNGIIQQNNQFAAQTLARNDCCREYQSRAAAIRDLTSMLEGRGTLQNFSKQEMQELLNFIAIY